MNNIITFIQRLVDSHVHLPEGARMVVSEVRADVLEGGWGGAKLTAHLVVFSDSTEPMLMSYYGVSNQVRGMAETKVEVSIRCSTEEARNMHGSEIISLWGPRLLAEFHLKGFRVESFVYENLGWNLSARKQAEIAKQALVAPVVVLEKRSELVVSLDV